MNKLWQRFTRPVREWLNETRLSRKARKPARRRLELEALEDRSLLATASGAVAGVAFVDANGNGGRDVGEARLPGISLVLSGITDVGNHVTLETKTGSDGGYSFTNVLPGTYQILASTGSVEVDGPTSADSAPTFQLAGGQSLTRDVAFAGLVPDLISMRQFLTSTTSDSFPYGSPGSGPVIVNYRENNTPVVKTALANVTVAQNSADTLVDLAGFFDDADTTNSQVALDTSSGTINVELFDKQTPRTVANYFNYILSDRYDNTIFHRLAPNFVLQGGGFELETNPTAFTTVVKDPAVQNEFDASRSNVQGTIAMAKLDNQPNSATDEFFFNLANNAGNLDGQNGGFTVFGKLVGAADQTVLNALGALPVKDESSVNSAFSSIPLPGYAGNNFPTDATVANFALLKNVAVTKRDEGLAYAVVANTNPGLVTATIVANRLTLDYAPNQTGTAIIAVRAVDRFGATVDTSFSVTVN